MSEEKRPPLKSAQQFLMIGLLAGLLFGCIGGSGLAWMYTSTSRIVYKGGAYPGELTAEYQKHYLATIIDSYVINRQVPQAQERLKSFTPVAKIRALAEQSANYAASGRVAEAEVINDLAMQLKAADGWQDDVIGKVIGDLSTQYANDAPHKQAIDQFSLKLLGAIPQLPVGQTSVITPTDQTAVITPTDQTAIITSTGQAEVAPPAQGNSWWWTACYCFLGLLLVVAIVFGVMAYFRNQTAKEMARKKAIKYEGPGIPPIMQWSSTYTFMRDPYDESFTLETKEGAFMGEAGISMNDADDEDRVLNFDAWVFDKTDIKTYSRVIMCQKSYDDETIRNRLKFNELAEAILAEPNKLITIETQTMRVEIKIVELELGENSAYFKKLKVAYDMFLKEGVNISVGEMIVPDHI